MAEVQAPTVHLLRGLHVTTGGGTRVAVPEGSKRLLAYVALNGRTVDRAEAATVLWPRVERERAAGNLRSAAWRLRQTGLDLLTADPAHPARSALAAHGVHKTAISLRPHVRTDLEGVTAWANRLLDGRPESGDLSFRNLAISALDLLPGWYDDWVLFEREHLRQTLLHAIEALAHLLVRAKRCGEAIEAALAAVSVEPLRETAQRVLMEAHLAEGNRCEAIRSYSQYQELLERELGTAPSVELRRLVLDRAGSG